jgi:hypothetical protein
MAGESLPELFAGFSGVFGDRCYAFRNTAARKGFPYLNANVQQQMLLYRPVFRDPESSLKPPNLAEAMSIAPGVNPANPEAGEMMLDVTTPSGKALAIDDPALIEQLSRGLRGENSVTLARSDRAMTDCRPISLISLQTLKQIDEEVGRPLDKRRFRSNIYIDLASDNGFAEDEFVGRKLRLGPTATVAVLERDPRCKMISLDPETAEHDPEVLRKVAQAHGAFAGVYCAVLIEGIISVGDPIEVID